MFTYLNTIYEEDSFEKIVSQFAKFHIDKLFLQHLHMHTELKVQSTVRNTQAEQNSTTVEQVE